jgi:hypothetical protein
LLRDEDVASTITEYWKLNTEYFFKNGSDIMKKRTYIGLVMGLTLVLLMGLAPQAARADLTLTAMHGSTAAVSSPTPPRAYC